MRTVLSAAVVSLVLSTPAWATCDFILDVENHTGKGIYVKDVYYKIHDSSWEILNAGIGMDVENGGHSWRPGHVPTMFKVSNLVVDCHGTEFRFKLTYNCHNDDSGPQTRHSDILKLGGDAVEATQVTVNADVKNCHGAVDFEM
jgi:hypothetical protein